MATCAAMSNAKALVWPLCYSTKCRGLLDFSLLPKVNLSYLWLLMCLLCFIGTWLGSLKTIRSGRSFSSPLYWRHCLCIQLWLLFISWIQILCYLGRHITFFDGLLRLDGSYENIITSFRTPQYTIQYVWLLSRCAMWLSSYSIWDLSELLLIFFTNYLIT